MIAEWKFVKAWTASFNHLIKNVQYVFVSAMLDLLFFFCLGLFATPFLQSVQNAIMNVGSRLSAPLREGVPVTQAMFSPGIEPHTKQLVLAILLLVLVICVVFVLFQQPVWWLAHKIVFKKKISWRTHLLGFGRISAFWIVSFALAYVLLVIAKIRGFVVQAITRQGRPEVMEWFLFVLLALIIYFALVSCPYLSVKKGFVFGVKKARVFVPGTLLVLITFLAANFLVTLLPGMLRLALATIVLLLLFAWARLYVEQLSRS